MSENCNRQFLHFYHNCDSVSYPREQPHSERRLSLPAEAPFTLTLQKTSHSERRLVTGFAREALIDWKLTVASVISRAAPRVAMKIQMEMAVR